MKYELSAIEERIKELVPRLKELSFGCKFQFTDRFEHRSGKMPERYLGGNFIFISSNLRWEGNIQTSEIRQIKMFFKPEFGNEVICLDVGQEVSREYFYKNLEIVGHPISLESVLEAVSGGLWAVDTGGYFIEFDIQNKRWFRQDYFPVWRMGKPLSEQTEETQQFIGSIIFNNKK